MHASDRKDAENAKAILRKKIREARKNLSADFRDKTAQAVALSGQDLVERLCARGEKIATYWPLREEISTIPLITALQASGFETLLPVVAGADKTLIFRPWRVGDALDDGPFGVKQPTARAVDSTPDFVFAPVVAFDQLGNRLGFGAGYYDFTLQSLRNSRKTFACGLAFACQQAPSVPSAPHDQKLDFIITENKVFNF